MTTTETVPYSNGGNVVPGEVVYPDAIASGKESGVFGLSQVVRALINGSPHAFSSEEEKRIALEKVDTFTRSHVPHSSRQALMTGDEMAPVEDVSQRVPPPQTTFGTPVQAPGIDYRRLAAEIVRQLLTDSAPLNTPSQL